MLFCTGSSTLCVRVVGINTSLCANVVGAPRIYFALINSIDIEFLTPQYGNLIDFASVYKGTIDPRDDWFRQLKSEWGAAGSLGCVLGEEGGEVRGALQGNQVLPTSGTGVKGCGQSGWREGMGTDYLMNNDSHLWGWREGRQRREAQRESGQWQSRSPKRQEALWPDPLADMWVFILPTYLLKEGTEGGAQWLTWGHTSTKKERERTPVLLISYTMFLSRGCFLHVLDLS